MAGRLHFRLDFDLQKEIVLFAKRNGLNLSQAARDLLRQALGNADPVDRGWREGFALGYAEVTKSMNLAARDAAESPPDQRKLPSWMRVHSGGKK